MTILKTTFYKNSDCRIVPGYEMARRNLAIPRVGGGVTPEFLASANAQMVTAGHNRTRGIWHRVDCPACDLCAPVRTRVEEFVTPGNLERYIDRNADLKTLSGTTRDIQADHIAEYADLYLRHHRAKPAHHEMQMTLPLAEMEIKGLMGEPLPQDLIELRLNGRLVGFRLHDRLRHTDSAKDGYSANQSVHDPDLKSRGLGYLLCMTLIQKAYYERIPYVYWGDATSVPSGLLSKLNYQPLDILTDDGWKPYSPGADIRSPKSYYAGLEIT